MVSLQADGGAAKILIADDSPTIVDVLQFLLQSQGYDVITAADGIEAIAKTYECAPDLILLDIEMPKMNGYQVCRLLKSTQTTKTIPIIILTSRGQKRDRFWGLSTGADEFMTKDFESEQALFRLIDEVLHRSPLDQQPIAGPHQSSLHVPITEVSVLEQVNHILDRQLFQATIINHVSSLATTMHSFQATIKSLFSLLGKVCEFQIASIFLKDESAYHAFLYETLPIDPKAEEQVKQRVCQEYQTYQPSESLEHVAETLLRDERQTPGVTTSPVRAQQLMTFFSLPLKVRDTVVGVLALGSTREQGLSPEIIDTLHVFTKEASIVLDNALLVKQLEQSNRELEDTVAKLKNTQSQLVQSEKMASLGQLVAGVAHEINTPAGAINAATSNLINFLGSMPDSFRLLLEEKFTPEDQRLLLEIVIQLMDSITQKRKSTMTIREETRQLESLLEQQGFSHVRHLAKQMARLNLQPESIQALIQTLRHYNDAHIADFLEKCSKIVNASKDIRISIDIITQIVNALKMYSRLDQAKVEEVDIHEGIETTLIILRSQIKYGISIERHFCKLPKIPCYVNELNQVWTNIIHNAIQAMKGEGTLTIETYLLPQASESEKKPGRQHHQASPSSNQKIGVKISDTGPGIPAAIQDKIFDPYFTTKDQGEGSGLGLGIARQIVERHHGEIRVTSQPGKTCFDILLPVSGLKQEYLAQ